MKFTVNSKAIKTRELLEAQSNMETLIDIMARFMHDENEVLIPLERAKDILLETDLEELFQVQEDFLAAFNLQRKSARR